MLLYQCQDNNKIRNKQSEFGNNFMKQNQSSYAHQSQGENANQIYFIISTPTQQNQLLILTPKNYKRQFKQFIIKKQSQLTTHQIQAIKHQIQSKIRQLAEEVIIESTKTKKINKHMPSVNKDDHFETNTKAKSKSYHNVQDKNKDIGVKSPHFKSIQQEEMMESSIEKVQISCSSQSQSQKQPSSHGAQDQYQSDESQRNFQESYQKSANKIYKGQQQINEFNQSKPGKKDENGKKDQHKYQQGQQVDLTQTKPQTVKKQQSNEYQAQNQQYSQNLSKKTKQKKDILFATDNSLNDNISNHLNSKSKKKCLLLENYTKGQGHAQYNYAKGQGHAQYMTQYKNKSNSNSNNKSISSANSTQKKHKPNLEKQKKYGNSSTHYINKTISKKEPFHKEAMHQNDRKYQIQKQGNFQTQKQLTHHMFFRLNQQQWHTSSFRNKSKEHIDYIKKSQIKEAQEIQQYKKYKAKQLNLKYNAEVFNKLYQTQTESSFNRNNKSKSKELSDTSIEKQPNVKKGNFKQKTYTTANKALVEDKRTCRKRCQKILVQKQRYQQQILRKSREKQIRKNIKSRSQQCQNNTSRGKSKSGQCQCCHYQVIQKRQLSKQKIIKQKQRLQKQKRQKRRLMIIQRQKNQKPKRTHQYISNILSESYEELFKDEHIK